MKVITKRNTHRHRVLSRKGFILPIVIILGLSISAVSVTAFRTVSDSSVTLSDQYYNSLAREAAVAGVQLANACIKSGGTLWTDTAPLKPETNCQGTVSNGALPYVSKHDDWTSSFSVKAPVNTPSSVTVTSVGTATLRAKNGSVVRSYSQNVKAVSRISIGDGFKPVVEMTTGLAHTCVVAEGDAYCWGLNSSGQIGSGTLNDATTPVAVSKNPLPTPEKPAQPAGCGGLFKPCTTPAIPAQPASALAGKTVTKITGGNNHTCAIANDEAYCWGENANGQLGTGGFTRSLVPVAVNVNPLATPSIPAQPAGCGGLFKPCTTPAIPAQPASALANKKVIDIQAGQLFTCALTDDGKVSCWGENAYGQLGVNDRIDRTIPTSVYTPSGSPLFNKPVKKIGEMSNSQHICVITEDDIPVCWGRNFGGQVGNDVDLPDDRGSCGGLTPPISKSADALAPTNVYLGDATTNSYWFGKSTRPASSIKGLRIIALNTVGNYTNVIGSDNRVHWWGGSTSVSSPVCHEDGERKERKVRRYNSHSRPVGPVYREFESCWSWPTMTCSVNNLLTNKQITISSGSVNTGVFCAVANGEVFCDGPWYWDYQGQLGDGRPLGWDFGNWDFSPDPVRVKIDSWLNGRTVIDLDTGGSVDWNIFTGPIGSYTCALADQAVACWGVNVNGQLGTGDKVSKNVPTPVFTGGALSKPGTVNISNPIIF